MGEYLTAINQDPTEIAAFVDLLVGEGVGSYLEIGCKFGGSLWSQTATPGNYSHAKCLGPRNHFRTDLSHAHQAKGSTEKPASFGKLFLVPFAGAQSDHVVGNASIQCEDQGESQLGHGD